MSDDAICWECNGTGNEECGNCCGSGWDVITDDDHDGDEDLTGSRIVCPGCSGTGMVECSNCGGSGRV